MKLLIMALLLVSALAEANDKFYNQLKWVQWSVQQEEQNPTEVVKTFLNSFNAYAYKEGDSCLVLGYQGKFTRGVCRLDKTTIDKNSCAASYYPCQPLLFGEGICIKNNTKRLTNQCAVESLKKVTAKIKETENLIAFKEALLKKDFDITKLEAKDFPPEVQAVWPDEVTPEKLSQRKEYLGQLCQAVKQGKATGHQVQDLKDCESLHALASILVKKEPETKPKILKQKEVSKEGSSHVNVGKKDCDKCEQEIKKDDPKINDLQTIMDKIKKKENLLPEEISTPINFKDDLKEDYCYDARENNTQDERYLNTKNYKDEGFSKPENRLLSVELLKNDAGIEEAQAFGFEAHTMGNIVDTIDKGESVETYEPTVPHRDWSAEFPGRSHQMTITVTDWPVLEDKDSKGESVKQRYNSANLTMTRYTFFPRKVTPAISKVDGQMLMTLPTGESVAFNEKTRRVESGAFKETLRSDKGVGSTFTRENGDRRRYYKPDSDFSYEGKGVWIETKDSVRKQHRLRA